MKRVLIVGVVALFLVSCGGYNTSFNPPGAEEKLNDVFPKSIGSYKRGEIRKSKGVGGFEVYYGGDKMFIRLISFNSGSQAAMAMKRAIYPLFDAMPTHFRGNVNGSIYAKGKEKSGRRWYAWVNKNIVFVINGADESFLNKLIDTFPYISRD